MLVVILSLLSSVTVSEVTLDTNFIENLDSQWIAPGYRLAEELIIDPIDYGMPLLNLNGARNVIGFQPFFVDTPEGEKWRIVLSYEGEVVVLEEDSEQRRFRIEKSSTYMLNSPNGRFVLLGLEEEKQTPVEMMFHGIVQPERKVVLLDIETGNQVTASGLSGTCLMANDGHIISMNDDSLYFYDSSFNLLNSVHSCIRQTSHTLTSYASDGSLFVRQYREYPDDSIYTLRGYDRAGNVLWDSFPPDVGWPAVSDCGDYVFVLTWGRLMCLDGNNGQLLWEEPHENEGEGLLMISSRRGAAYAFETDVMPSEARANPLRKRVLNVGIIGQDNNPTITRIGYQSDMIDFFSPKAIANSGCSLWRMYLHQGGGMDLSIYKLCLFSHDGRLIYAQLISEADSRYGNIWNNSVSTALRPYAVNSTGRGIVWWDRKNIHILTLIEEGVSE